MSSEEGMLTPFMIAGPGVKKGFALPSKINHQDHYPTIFKLMGLKTPGFVEGRVITELLTSP
jgi:arylsulfatase A-like enzyme